jgi:hypothetical protein
MSSSEKFSAADYGAFFAYASQEVYLSFCPPSQSEVTSMTQLGNEFV